MGQGRQAYIRAIRKLIREQGLTDDQVLGRIAADLRAEPFQPIRRRRRPNPQDYIRLRPKIGLRVGHAIKGRIERAAARAGVNVSEYLEAITLGALGDPAWAVRRVGEFLAVSGSEQEAGRKAA